MIEYPIKLRCASPSYAEVVYVCNGFWMIDSHDGVSYKVSTKGVLEVKGSVGKSPRWLPGTTNRALTLCQFEGAANHNQYSFFDENLQLTSIPVVGFIADPEHDFKLQRIRESNFIESVLLNGEKEGLLIYNKVTKKHKILSIKSRLSVFSSDGNTILTIGKNKITILDNPLV